MDKVEITQIVPLDQSYFVEDNGCWIWEGTKDKDGYGLISITRNNSKSKLRAHRVFYEMYKGPIPNGLLVCHRCDNPSCVNPEHLFIGTAKINTQDAVNKGRIPKGESHPLLENLDLIMLEKLLLKVTCVENNRLDLMDVLSKSKTAF